MIKKLIAIFCCFILVLSISACQKKEVPAIATLDGENIDEAYFKYYFIQMKKQMQNDYGEVSWQNATFEGKPALEYVKEWALQKAIEDKIVIDKAKEDGISLSDADKKEINSVKQSWVKNYGDRNAFYDAIKTSYGLSAEQFNYMLEAVYYRKHLVKKYVGEEKISEYYNTNIVKVKHILIPTVDLGTNAPLTEDELLVAQNKVNKVLKEIKMGKEFDSLVAEYTSDQDTFYYVGEGYSLNIDGSRGVGMVSAFETAAFELEVGDISNIVESPYGYHIIKRYENDEAMYHIAKENLASIIFTDILEEWKAQKSLVIDNSIYNSYE